MKNKQIIGIVVAGVVFIAVCVTGVFSNVVSNSYNSIASADTSENANLSQSISNYSNALIRYNSLIEEAENNNA